MSGNGWPLFVLLVRRLATTICAFVLLASLSGAASDDNVIAQRLFKPGDYAEAAEIFTDPVWKGIALYKSSQWWRAADAFVRANDAASIYNLGNTYVQLGYYALALEAYQGALQLQSDFPDARHNAELMRNLLAKRQDQQGDENPARRGDEIERVESQSDASDKAGGDAEAGDEQASSSGKSGSSEGGKPASEGDGNASNNNRSKSEIASQNPDESPTGGATKGQQYTPAEKNTSSGNASSESSMSDAQAAGIRSSIEAAQATEQWLNQISHEPLKYLQKRIEHELARRQAAGETAPQGGNQW